MYTGVLYSIPLCLLWVYLYISSTIQHSSIFTKGLYTRVSIVCRSRARLMFLTKILSASTLKSFQSRCATEAYDVIGCFQIIYILNVDTLVHTIDIRQIKKGIIFPKMTHYWWGFYSKVSNVLLNKSFFKKLYIKESWKCFFKWRLISKNVQKKFIEISSAKKLQLSW